MGSTEIFAISVRHGACTNRFGNRRSWRKNDPVGYSPAGGSYFEIGLRSNAFASLVSYSGDYRLFTPDLMNSLGQGATVVGKALQAIENAADSLSDDSYLQVLDELT